jgi:hypothetical protein
MDIARIMNEGVCALKRSYHQDHTSHLMEAVLCEQIETRVSTVVS